MAPGRKRGGAKGANHNQLILGDLVLAKVKGFPAWPAKISKPEDWKQTPDPRKYFVQFFGTEEIAFVAPVDIQPFTNESKDKLLIRCKGKTVKYFSEAVNEICDTFEESEYKSSDSLKDDNFIQMVDDGMITDGPSCATSSNEMGFEDVNSSVSLLVARSPSLFTKKPAESCNDDTTSGAGHNTSSKTGSHVETNGQKSKKIANASNNIYADVANPESDVVIRKSKKVLKDKTHNGSTDNLSKELLKDNRVLHPAKKSKLSNEVPKKSQSLRKSDVARKGNNEEVKQTKSNLKNGVVGDEDVAQPTKRRRVIPKNEEINDLVKSGPQVHMKKRAVFIFNEDDDDLKTPVHGRSSKLVDNVSQTVTSVKAVTVLTNFIQDSPTVRENVNLKESAAKSSKSPKSLQDISEVVEQKLLHTPAKSESEKNSPEEILKVFVSPVKSPFDGYAKRVESSKVNKSLGFGNISQNNSKSSSFKHSSRVYDGGYRSQNNNAVNEKISPVLRKPSDINLSSSERSDIKAVQTTSLNDSKNADANTSMSHLIAVAQAKRKQSQSHNVVHESVNFPNTETVEKSPHSISAVQQITTGQDVMTQTEDQIDSLEVEEMTGSGNRPAGGSVSVGTDAVVARDAFEGMLETLSRTKESIGRATRHAIDCAKYGIANEVVELLTMKLESESSFHRRVDLFFLVDSITQCSHSQKGIAGASYIPTVQAALPRLLGVAAPPGANARENRRQCLKILKLWLERKILPETLLQSYIEAIGSSTVATSALISSKRQPRSERAVNNPIREMEGILVDEYGSNETFQLPGLLSSSVFEEDDEDDNINFSNKERASKSTPGLNTATCELETCSTTSNERRHCILEDVDGELEMEDVSIHPKDENYLTGGESYKVVQEDEGSNNSSEMMSPFREGSPPLPPDSPPPTPPLPSSPPPPLPSQTYLIHVGPPQVLFSQPSMLPMSSNVSINSRIGTHVDSAYLPTVPTNTHETYTKYQISQSNQLYQTGNILMPSRTFQTPMVNQTVGGQFQYLNSAMMRHPYPNLYGLTKPLDGLTRYGGDEQWQPPLNEFSNDGQRGVWLTYGRSSLSATPFVQDGYFRPPTNKVNFQPVGQNIVSTGAPNPGHNGSLIMPSLNSWRPA